MKKAIAELKEEKELLKKLKVQIENVIIAIGKDMYYLIFPDINVKGAVRRNKWQIKNCIVKTVTEKLTK